MNNNSDISPKVVLSFTDYPTLKLCKDTNKKSPKIKAPKRKNSEIMIIGQKSVINSHNKNNEKTRFCKSITGGYNKICRYGDKCKFSHSFEQLKVVKCRFGDDCDKINSVNDTICNVNDNRICYYIHPQEDKKHFSYRTNIIKHDNENNNVKNYYNPYRFPEQIHLKIPKQLAAFALEKSLIQGKTDIRLELI